MDWGVLHLSTAAGDIPQAVWADVSMNRILTVAMLVIVYLANLVNAYSLRKSTIRI